MQDDRQTTARPTIDFVRATIFGGLLFLLPLGLVLFLLGYIFATAKTVLDPLAEVLVKDTDARLGVLSLLAIVALVLVAFLAGLFARTALGKSTLRRVEQSFLGNIPQYRMMKNMGQSMARIENNDAIEPVLIQVEGGWQLGYITAKLPGGWTTVFLPQAPTPLSGTILYVPADKVRKLNIPIGEAMRVVTMMGVNSMEVLDGVDLTLPVGGIGA